jgi:hypothetical protein
LCSTPLAAGVEASWYAATRRVFCAGCVDAPPEVSSGAAGASARAKAERLRAKGEEHRRQLKERRPILGRLAIGIAGPPTDGHSYAKGAVGEEKLGAALDTMVANGLLVLHDRRRPRTAANIDHLVVAPTGVWVIDAKRYSGLITKVDKGGWLQSDIRLTVGGRDRTKLVAGVQTQMSDVRQVLDGPRTAVPLHGALCFVDAELRLFAKPFEIDGVLVTWTKALCERMATSGPIDAKTRTALHRHLAASLPPR